MLPIIGSLVVKTLVGSGLSALGKMLNSDKAKKISDDIKKKTGIDLTSITDGVLSGNQIDKLKEYEQSPEFLLEMKELELEEMRIKLESDDTRLESVNRTMRVEATSDSWVQRSWRPIVGLISGGIWGLCALTLCILSLSSLWISSSIEYASVTTAITNLKEIMFNPSFWIFPTTATGLAVHSRGKEKRDKIRVGIETNNTSSNLVDKITNKIFPPKFK